MNKSSSNSPKEDDKGDSEEEKLKGRNRNSVAALSLNTAIITLSINDTKS